MTDSDIGRWCQRNQVDRIQQTGRWHLIESEVADGVVTRCGRTMARKALWYTPGLYSPIPNGLNIFDRVPNFAMKCSRCLSRSSNRR